MRRLSVSVGLYSADNKLVMAATASAHVLATVFAGFPDDKRSPEYDRLAADMADAVAEVMERFRHRPDGDQGGRPAKTAKPRKPPDFSKVRPLSAGHHDTTHGTHVPEATEGPKPHPHGETAALYDLGDRVRPIGFPNITAAGAVEAVEPNPEVPGGFLYTVRLDAPAGRNDTIDVHAGNMGPEDSTPAPHPLPPPTGPKDSPGTSTPEGSPPVTTEPPYTPKRADLDHVPYHRQPGDTGRAFAEAVNGDIWPAPKYRKAEPLPVGPVDAEEDAAARIMPTRPIEPLVLPEPGAEVLVNGKGRPYGVSRSMPVAVEQDPAGPVRIGNTRFRAVPRLPFVAAHPEPIKDGPPQEFQPALADAKPWPGANGYDGR